MSNRAQELCESRGGRPGLPVPNSPYGLRGHKAILNLSNRAQELCESRGGRPGLPVPNSPCGFCGRKATLNLNCTYLVAASTFQTDGSDCMRFELSSFTIRPKLLVYQRRQIGKRTTSVRFFTSALLSLQQLWFIRTVS